MTIIKSIVNCFKAVFGFIKTRLLASIDKDLEIIALKSQLEILKREGYLDKKDS